MKLADELGAPRQEATSRVNARKEKPRACGAGFFKADKPSEKRLSAPLCTPTNASAGGSFQRSAFSAEVAAAACVANRGTRMVSSLALGSDDEAAGAGHPTRGAASRSSGSALHSMIDLVSVPYLF